MNSFTTGGKDAVDPGAVSSEQMTTTLLGLVDQRTQRLESVRSVRNSRLRRMEIERKRLGEKLPPDSPRLAALDARIEENRSLVTSLGDEIYRSRTPLPTPVPDAWTIFGSVRDAARTGIEGLSIVFYSVDGKRVDSLGYTCTGVDGYFRMESRDRTIDGKSPVYLRVVDRNGNTLYADTVQLVPAIGGIDYREIILAEKICTPPKESSANAATTRPNDTGIGGMNEIRPTGNAETTNTTNTTNTGSPSATVAGTPAARGADKPEALHWTVRGRVTDAGGKPVAGLIVTLLDRDLVFDDRLGQAETNGKGEYELIYSSDTFRDLLERQPDLYVRVADRSGKQLYRSKKMLRPNAGQVEIVDIKLSK
jgi:hypothetical protein